MKNTTYHRILRVSALTLAFVLLFDSGLLTSTTRELSQGTQSYLAAVIGMQAGVEPTELNQMTAALTQKEQMLAQREALLTERELAIGLQGKNTTPTYSTYILSILLFAVLVLLVLNYILDFARMRKAYRSYETVA